MLLFAVAALIMLSTAAIVAYPLFFQAPEPHLRDAAPGADFSERDALLDALDELEQAFFGGKLSEPDYEAQRGILEAQYVRIVEAAARPQTARMPAATARPRKGRRD